MFAYICSSFVTIVLSPGLRIGFPFNNYSNGRKGNMILIGLALKTRSGIIN